MDLGISRTYSAASAESDGRDLQALKGLLEKEWQGLPERQVVARLQAFIASRPAGSVVLKRRPEETDSIYFEGFRLEFRDGKFYRVTSPQMRIAGQAQGSAVLKANE